MSDDPLKIDIDGPVATLTLNRPESKNALNREIRDRMRKFIVEEAPALQAVIVTGTGAGFCAGMDMKERMGIHESREQWSLFRSIFNCPTVFIAAVNGPAIGAGITFVNACDLAIADPSAIFGLPAVNYGFYSSVAATTSQLALPKKVIAHMLLTGLPLGAEEAVKANLINSVSAPGESLTEARKIADRIADFKAHTLSTIKQAVNTIPYDDGDRNKGEQLAVAINISNLPYDPTEHTLGTDKINRN